MKAQTRRWTQEELAQIRQDYRGTIRSKQQLADRYQVTVNQINRAISLTGALSKNDRQRRWTPEEDARLAWLAQRLRPQSIAAELNRTLNAVTVRMVKLGISRRPTRSWYTMSEAAAMLGKDHRWVTARLDSGQLAGQRVNRSTGAAMPAREEGVAKSSKGTQATPGAASTIWRIEEEDLRNYVRSHCDELTGANVNLPALIRLLTGPLPGDHRPGDPSAGSPWGEGPIKPGQTVRYGRHLAIFHYQAGNKAIISLENDQQLTVPILELDRPEAGPNPGDTRLRSKKHERLPR